MLSLHIALFVFRYPCFSVHLCSAITLSFLLLLLSVIPGESDHVFYMTDKSSCSTYKLYAALGHLCGVLTVQGLFPNVWSIAWSHHCYICYLFVSPFFCPVPSHSCDPLEDLLPSLSQHGFVSTLPDDEDLEFWQWYLRIHFDHWWIPLLQLLIIIYWLTNCWILSMFDFSLPLFTWLGLYWFFGILMKTLVSHIWTKLHNIMFHLCTHRPDIWRLVIILYCGFDPPL